jgi:hypothetical protein
MEHHMPGSRLVPTLAALFLAGGLAASDGVAPVITLLSSDLPQPTVYRDESSPAAALNCNSLLSDLYLYNSASTSGSPWEEFLLNTLPLPVDAAGIAIVAADTRGFWQYRVNAGTWQSIPAVDDENAFLLALTSGGSGNQTELRFVPDGAQFSGNDTATLTFRAWDGTERQGQSVRDNSGDSVSTANTDSAPPQPYGGSPTPFSAETRTLSIAVLATSNNPPAINDPNGVNGTTIDVTAGSSVTVDLSASDDVGDILSWSTSSIAYGTSGSISDYSGSGFTYNADGAVGTEIVTFIVTDGHGGYDSVYVTFNVLNDPPVIYDELSIDGTTIDVEAGTTIDLANVYGVYADDPNGQYLSWNNGYTVYGYQNELTYSPYLASVGNSEAVTFTVDDGYGGTASITVTFNVIAPSNHAPILADYSGLDNSEGYTFDVRQGGSHTFTVQITDEDGDPISWDFYYNGETYDSPYAGSLSDPIIDPDGSYTFTYTHDGVDTYGDYFNLSFTDGNGGELQVWISVSAIANSLPQVITEVPDLAVVGRPYDALITIEDADADTPLTLSVVEQEGIHIPAGFTLTAVTPTVSVTQGYNNVTQRTFRLRGVPTATGTLLIDAKSNDGVGTRTQGFSITIDDPAVQAITRPNVPVSTPGNPIYAAIAPGSTTGFSSVMGALAPHGPDVARAWWWSTANAAFYDASTSPVSSTKQPSTALFLASTVALSYSFDAKPYPMPFAIDLPPAHAQATGPGTDGWTFFGVPALWDGTVTHTSHDLSDFCLETADGVRVGSIDTILTALAPNGDMTVQEPWLYDPSQPVDSRYLPAPTLESGSGYWIRNRSTTAYRLVRVNSASTDLRITGTYGIYTAPLPAARPAAMLAAASAADLPPAPPSGSTTAAPTSSGSSGGCGAGNLAGLLLAGLTLLGLRSRRRN